MKLATSSEGKASEGSSFFTKCHHTVQDLNKNREISYIFSGHIKDEGTELKYTKFSKFQFRPALPQTIMTYSQNASEFRHVSFNR